LSYALAHIGFYPPPWTSLPLGPLRGGIPSWAGPAKKKPRPKARLFFIEQRRSSNPSRPYLAKLFELRRVEVALFLEAPSSLSTIGMGVMVGNDQ